MKKQIYISGRITGLDFDVAYKSFFEAEIEQGNNGFEVINPMRINHDHDKTWESYMKVDLKALIDCTHIFMMKGWQYSRGAIIEFNLAKDLGLEIIFE